MKSLLPIAIILCVCLSATTGEPPCKSFREDFDDDTPEHFSYGSGGSQAEFTRTFGVNSPTEHGTVFCFSK